MPSSSVELGEKDLFMWFGIFHLSVVGQEPEVTFNCFFGVFILMMYHALVDLVLLVLHC